jgi:dihydrodipicolinate synthase/N-acetylneuraminate lyase
VSGARITGTLAAAVTPLRDGGQRLDPEAFGPLLEFYSASGLDGVFLLGTTGEGILLGEAERRQAAELAIEASGRLAAIVNCGAQATAETSTLAAHAAEAGADGVAVVGPPYYQYEPRELLEHFAAAAAACAPLPFYIYEFADRCGYAVPVAVIDQLRERAPNLTGMKVSDTPFEWLQLYLGTGLDIFVGAEGLIPQGLAAGAVGTVSGVAAAFPEEVSALVRTPGPAGLTRVQSLRAALSRHPFQASVKSALGWRGIPVRPDVRPPLQPLSAEQAEDLRGLLERLEAEAVPARES